MAVIEGVSPEGRTRDLRAAEFVVAGDSAPSRGRGHSPTSASGAPLKTRQNDWPACRRSRRPLRPAASPQPSLAALAR